MAGNGRETALEVLTACRKLEAWSDGTLKAACRRGGLDRRELAFAARLTYGVLQNAALLDFSLGQYCAQPVEKLEPFVRDVLRLGACQILLMDRVPDSAAVSQAVEMVKNHRRQRAAGLVNAVLRKLSTNKERLPAIPAEDPAEYLSLRYSHPRWLAGRLVELLGREEAEAFLAADNEAAPLVIQHNPLRCTAEELVQALEDAGASAVAVHGRTREQYYEGSADWKVIADVKHAVGIPVIGNGDVMSGEDAVRMLDETGCDGVMIARGALGNPWIFREAEALWNGDMKPVTPSDNEKINMLLDHFALICADKGDNVAVREIRKHIGWYVKGMRGASYVKRTANKITQASELIELLRGLLK